jgi:aldose 1-epimerase
VAVLPDQGGRIAQIAVGDVPLLVDVPADRATTPMAWGDFVMAPWVGRIREGRFDFDGRGYQLDTNHRDGDGDPRRIHSIHGTVWNRSWEVTASSEDGVTLRRELGGALGWPFDGVVEHQLTLHADRMDQTLTVTTEHGRMPAEIGWHPWFRKPDRLSFGPAAMYRRDRFGIPNGELIAPTTGPWDDCFVNTEPVRLHNSRADVATVTLISDCTHWVVYDEPPDATCVEPQSGPPDAFNLVHHVVTPESPLRRSLTIAW